MAFVALDKNLRLRDKEGELFYPVGINYVASYICTNFWEDFRPDVIYKDLKLAASLGVRALRIPMNWGFMEPEERVYNEAIFPMFDRFLDWCRALDMYLMPWFLVGIATQDYDVPFRNGRPFFTGDMVDVARDHIRHFVSRYRDEERILMWDLCDEPEYYCRNPGAEQWPFDRDDLRRWVRTLYDGVKEADPNHLVTLGFGHIASANFGYHELDMAEILDLMVVTCYPLELCPDRADCLRNNYFLPFYVAFNRPYGNAVMTCEAPGFSSVMFSEAVIGRYYRAGLYGQLAEGSNGVLPWAMNDFDPSIWHQRPLEEYVLEPSFGVVAVDGRVKPSGKELRSFAGVVKELGLARYHRERARVAVVVPRDYYQQTPLSFRRVYLAYLFLKGCGVSVDLLWQGLPTAGYDLLVIADTSGFTTSYWDRLRRCVRDGGQLFWMFDGNSGLNVYFNDLFGLEVQSPAKWHGATPAGSAAVMRLETEAVKAQVLAEFEDGTPLLTRHGSAWFLAMQWTDGLLECAESVFERHPLHRVMEFLVQESRIDRPVRVENVNIEVSRLVCEEDGQALYLLINHANHAVSSRLRLEPALGDVSQIGREGLCADGEELVWQPCETLILRTALK